MTDELEPLPEPVVENLDGEEDEGFDLVEPENATRLSPFAIASFIVALLGAFDVPSIVSTIVIFAQDRTSNLSGPSLVRGIVEAIAPLAFSGVALWLAVRAEAEVLLDERLGGVGFYRAARVVALVSMTLLVLAVVGGIVWFSLTSHSHSPTFP